MPTCRPDWVWALGAAVFLGWAQLRPIVVAVETSEGEEISIAEAPENLADEGEQHRRPDDA